MADIEDAPFVRVGQLWADNDRRSTGRHVLVVSVSRLYADVIAADPAGQPSPDADRARRSRIRLTRFRPTATGYRFIRTVTDQERTDGRG